MGGGAEVGDGNDNSGDESGDYVLGELPHYCWRSPSRGDHFHHKNQHPLKEETKITNKYLLNSFLKILIRD